MSSSQHRWVVDSVEEQTAAVEVDGRQVLPLPLWLLPAGVMEGHVLAVTHERGPVESRLTVAIDAEGTREAVRQAERQVRHPRGADPGGDIAL